MKNFIKGILVTALLFSGSVAASAAELGKEYRLLNPPQPVSSKKIEVLEFFYYGCSHCFDLHKPLSIWEKKIPKDVELIYVPTIFRDSMEPMARTFYALDSMGMIHKMHDAIYRALMEESRELRDVASISDYVSTKGVDRKKFTAAYNSFAMQSKVTRAKQMIRSYGVGGTPTLVVDGKYLITGLYPQDTLRVLNEVIAMARDERSGGR